ncbi:MAG: hypothetical protein BWX61_01398 [Bacteroidetes bacterium ADurb.Bin035]|jgi:hypothetical protein|nr:MAG: hypothetical protein BWX61_01398 [Bacteroidetes bacterium ADurb.Bin035]
MLKKTLTTMLIWSSLLTYSQATLRKDSVKCLTNEQIKVINNTFVDLDACEQENKALSLIISVQDTMLKSKIELQKIYDKQIEWNDELKYQLTSAFNLQVQRYHALENSIKQAEKKQKRKRLGLGLGIGIAITGLLIFQIIK